MQPGDARVCQHCYVNISAVAPLTGIEAEEQIAADHAAARARARLIIERQWRVVLAACIALLIGFLFPRGTMPASIAVDGTLSLPPIAGETWSGGTGGYTGNRATTGVLSPDAAVAWSLDTAAPITGISADAQRIYVATTDARLTAFDAATGAELWAFAVPGQLDQPPAIVDGVIYINQRNSHTLALDAATGQVIWDRFDPRLGLLITSPVLHQGVLWIGAQSAIYAMDAADAAVRAVDPFRMRVNTTPVIAGDFVAVAVTGELRIISRSRAERTYHYPISQLAHVVAVGDMVIALNPRFMLATRADATQHWWEGVRARFLWTDYYIRGLAPAPPPPRREWLTSLSASPFAPAAGDGRIYVATRDGAVRAYYAATGLPVWERTDAGARGALTLTPDGLLVPVADGLTLLDIATGDQRTTWALPAPIRHLIVTEGGAYVAVGETSAARTLIALR